MNLFKFFGKDDAGSYSFDRTERGMAERQKLLMFDFDLFRKRSSVLPACLSATACVSSLGAEA